MGITQKTIKLLWGNAAGRCAFPNCPLRLCTDSSGPNAPYTIGEMAHICGEKPEARRYNASQSPSERDGYGNLILLCPTHHTTIDKIENELEYSVAKLNTMKSNHEIKANRRFDTQIFRNKYEVATHIYPLLVENHQSFLSYGPQSEIARRNPVSDAYGIWLSERLSTILPNNRAITDILKGNVTLFASSEQPAVSRFLIHARRYEAWVIDDVTYETVIRFPTEFEEIILGLINAGTQ